MKFLASSRKAFLILSALAVSLTVAAQQTGRPSQALDTTAIRRITGMKGMENKGEYKITVPQNDLKVEVDGFKVIPPMGLGSWAAFTPAPGGAMVMGDIIVTETDLKPV